MKLLVTREFRRKSLERMYWDTRANVKFKTSCTVPHVEYSAIKSNTHRIYNGNYCNVTICLTRPNILMHHLIMYDILQFISYVYILLLGGKQRRAKARFSYHPQADDELELADGNEVLVLEIVEEGWWKGRIGQKEGVFPSNFVEEMH